MRVADKIDAAHAGGRALVDLEHQIDPVLRKLDDLGLDRRGETGVPAVEVEDALDVVLHPGAGIDDARTKLDLGVEVLVGKLRITLEGDAIYDRVFDEPDD